MVEAHKFLLATHSPFFQKAFFGSGTKFREAGCDDFEIKDTTKEAFTDLVHFIYEHKINFGERSLKELYAVLNLSTMYEVERLKEVVGKHIVDFPITEATVVEVAATATDFAQFEVSHMLFSNCVTFVHSNFSSADSVIQFVRQNKDYPATVVSLVKAIPNICSNCKGNPCRNGQHPDSPSDIQPGTMMQTVSSWQWRPKYRNQKVRVEWDEGSPATVTWVEPPEPLDEDVGNPYTMDYTERTDFRFKCS